MVCSEFPSFVGTFSKSPKNFDNYEEGRAGELISTEPTVLPYCFFSFLLACAFDRFRPLNKGEAFIILIGLVFWNLNSY